MQLVLEEVVALEDPEAGIGELSGLCLSADGRSLWAVGDEKSQLVELDLRGRVLRRVPLPRKARGLEGISLSLGGKSLLGVREQGNRLLEIRPRRGVLRRNVRLSSLRGYRRLKRSFEQSPGNSGLEGVVADPGKRRVFVLKEKSPALLIEISPRLKRIREVRELGPERGFPEAGATGGVDYAGLCMDGARDCLWILSQQRRRVFLYDWGRDRVVGEAALEVPAARVSPESFEPEGIALGPRGDDLYVVSDPSSALYRFRIDP